MQIFAGFFHQDFDLLNEDAYEVARNHFSGISETRRAALRKELESLLEFRKSKNALMNEWWRLGAGSWQKGLDLRAALNDFVDML